MIKIRHIKLCDYISYTNHIHSDITYDYFENFINNILNDNHHIIVAVTDDIILGSITIFIEHKMTYNGCKMAHIENMLVEKDMRHQNIGSKLINCSVGIAKEQKCYRIDLACDESVKNFYIKNNFNPDNISMTMLIKDNFTCLHTTPQHS